VQVAATPGVTVVAWNEGRGDRRVVRARVRRDGRWAPARDLSDPAGRAAEPRVALAPDGGAVVAWRRDAGARDQVVEAARLGAGGRWRVRALGPVAGRARGLPRVPGPVPLGPAAAAAAGGQAAVAWPERHGGRDRVRLAVAGPDGWSPAATVPARGQAGAPDLLLGDDGRVLLALEELDGVDLALRVRSRAADGVWACCARLTRRGREGAAPRLAVGPGGAVAVWNATAQGGVATAALPC